ncbi:MAG TPA: hypothetical protein VEL03_07895 [Streptosporangiaceae bacterium]|nr:hypothetical protein [Streptosporangiaceae bacterium]
MITVMTLLTAGWPLINMAVSDSSALAANTKLTVGASHRSSGTVTMGPGWFMQTAQSDPQENYDLYRGPVQLSVNYVNLLNQSQTMHLWGGLQRLVRFQHPGSTLSGPAPITTVGGYKGLIGVLAVSNFTGSAAIFPSPSRKFAIEMIVLSPRGAAAAVGAAAIRTIRSLRFPPDAQ